MEIEGGGGAETVLVLENLPMSGTDTWGFHATTPCKRKGENTPGEETKSICANGKNKEGGTPGL